MSVYLKLRSLVQQASGKKIGELPQFFKQHFDTANLSQNLEAAAQNYKKTLIDKGDVRPLLHLIGGLFSFNYLFTLRSNMAHVQREQDARFGIHR